MLRIFFASDVHGSEKTFSKFLSAGKFYKASVVILGGDLTGKMMIPIVQQLDNAYRVHFLGSDYQIKNNTELETMEKNIRFNGYYPYRTTMEEKKELDADPSKVEQLFQRLMVEGIERWVKIADERLTGTDIKCFLMPGNDDLTAIDSVLEKSELIINPDGKTLEIDQDHEMISMANSNITPWNAPRDTPEEEIKERIDKMASQVKRMENCIFNFHCPPYDSNIDSAPKLKDFKPSASAAGVEMIPAGSVAVRCAIEKYQPLLGLHGHIHESQGLFQIGRTLCLNPGSEYSEGFLHGVIVALKGSKIESYQFTRG